MCVCLGGGGGGGCVYCNNTERDWLTEVRWRGRERGLSVDMPIMHTHVSATGLVNWTELRCCVKVKVEVDVLGSRS